MRRRNGGRCDTVMDLCDSEGPGSPLLDAVLSLCGGVTLSAALTVLLESPLLRLAEGDAPPPSLDGPDATADVPSTRAPTVIGLSKAT